MQNKKIKYIHLRGHYLSEDTAFPDAHGGITIAYCLDEGVVNYAIAKCYYKDRFQKKIGRAVASARLNSDAKKITLPIDKVKDNSLVVKALVNAFYCEEEAITGDDTIRLFIR